MSEIAVVECVDGVEVERTSSGRIRYLRIDLDTHPSVVSILQECGLVNGAFHKDQQPPCELDPQSHAPDRHCELDPQSLHEQEDDSWLIPTQAVEVDCRNIKWSKSMLESFDDIQNGRYKVGDINNFWRIKQCQL